MKRPGLKTTRRLVQLALALAFILIPYLNARGINLVHGNFLAFDLAGLPLADPLAALQVMVHNWPVPTRLWLGGLLVLVLALFLGTVFCSWACPFGLMSELVQSLGRRIWPGRKRQVHMGRGLVPKAYLGGLGLLAVGALSLPPVLNQLSLPGWYSRLFQVWFLQGYWSWAAWGLLLVLGLDLAAGRRFWCRYLCPQSLLLTLVQMLNPARLAVGFQPRRCHCQGGVSACIGACPLDLNPKALRGRLESECNNCGDCVVACRDQGRALGYGWGRRGREHGQGIPPAGL